MLMSKANYTAAVRGQSIELYAQNLPLTHFSNFAALNKKKYPLPLVEGNIRTKCRNGQLTVERQ